MKKDDWPFDQPQNCAAITMRQVLDGSEPILLVSHDEEDHGWQFIGTSDASEAAGRVFHWKKSSASTRLF